MCIISMACLSASVPKYFFACAIELLLVATKPNIDSERHSFCIYSNQYNILVLSELYHHQHRRSMLVDSTNWGESRVSLFCPSAVDGQPLR